MNWESSKKHLLLWYFIVLKFFKLLKFLLFHSRLSTSFSRINIATHGTISIFVLTIKVTIFLTVFTSLVHIIFPVSSQFFNNFVLHFLKFQGLFCLLI